MMAGGGGGEWFGAAIARTPIGLALVDRQARVHHANSSFLRLFVADGTEAAYSLVDEVDTRDRARVLTLIAEAVTGTTSSAPIEVRMRSNEQRSVWIYASVSHGGGPAELVISAVDVTEVRRLDRQQLVAEKLQAVRQLAAGLAHNLNNRVTSIVGNVDLLLERSDGNDPADDEIIEIRRGADQVAELVQGLSAFTDQPAAALEPVDLNAVVIDLEPLLDRVVGPDIAISIEVAVEPLNVRADRPQLEQVLIDLAISTRERMPEGGTLSVRTRAATIANLGWDAKDGYRCIEFVDSGLALPDEQLERMFEPFYSLSGPFASAELSTYPQARARSRRSGSRGLEPVVVDGFAVGAVARQTPGSVEDGQVAVGIFVHPDLRLDVVVAVAIGRDLQRAVLVAHGVVARDDAVLLGAEDVLERAGKSHEGRAGVRGDQLDAELRQGPADLGRVVLVHTAACLGRVPVVRGPIGVERAEQPVFGDHLAEPAERAHRALLGNEEARIDLRCRIVHGHDQVPPRARNPLVARAVLVQHHPHHRAARPLPAVRPAPGRRLDLAVRLQAQAKPVVAQPEAMLAGSSTRITSSTGARRAETRPRRRSYKPAAPSAS